MEKKETVKVKTGLFDKLKQNQADTPAAPAAPVIQEVVAVKKLKRDDETSYTMFINKKLHKKLQSLAIEYDTNVKEILCDLGREYIRSKGFEWGPGDEIVD